MTKLITRLEGRPVVIERMRTSFGPYVWTGEFTDQTAAQHVMIERDGTMGLAILIGSLPGRTRIARRLAAAV